MRLLAPSRGRRGVGGTFRKRKLTVGPSIVVQMRSEPDFAAQNRPQIPVEINRNKTVGCVQHILSECEPAHNYDGFQIAPVSTTGNFVLDKKN
jgi:hypothetical protein